MPDTAAAEMAAMGLLPERPGDEARSGHPHRTQPASPKTEGLQLVDQHLWQGRSPAQTTGLHYSGLVPWAEQGPDFHQCPWLILPTLAAGGGLSLALLAEGGVGCGLAGQALEATP